MTDRSRPLRLIGSPGTEPPRRDTDNAISWPAAGWLPIRYAAFDLYKRHRKAQEADDPEWAITFDRDDADRVRKIAVDFEHRRIILVADVGDGVSTPHHFEFTADDLARGFDHVSAMLCDDLRSDELRLARDCIPRFWHTMTRHAHRAIVSATVALHARVGSPSVAFTRVPPDAFEHYEITDWLKGVAVSSHGLPLFSPHLDLATAGPFLDQPSTSSPDYVALKKPGPGRRPRPVLDYTIEFLIKRYPNGPPRTLSLKRLARLASAAHHQEHKDELIISHETVRRALLELQARGRSVTDRH